MVVAVAIELADGWIQRDRDLVAGRVSRLLDRFDQDLADDVYAPSDWNVLERLS